MASTQHIIYIHSLINYKHCLVLSSALLVLSIVSAVQILVLSKYFDIICVTETWLSHFVYNNEILPSAFSVYGRDRASRGGGVMIVISDSVPSKLAFSAAFTRQRC